MTFDLSGIPEELQVFIKEALEMRKAALLFTEKEIKAAMQESINKIKKHIGHGTFKGITKELSDVIEEQKIFFAAELDRILDEGLTKASYAGLSIGDGILKQYKAKGLIKGRLIEKDIIREAELIAKSTMEKKRVFKNKEFVLSDRIWDLSGNNYEKIKEIISSGINTDCVKVAKALTQYVKQGSETLAKDYPNMYNRMGGRVPKNLNYEALRLARNELSEVYWQSTIEGYKDNPAIKAVKWLLSNNRIPGFHDVCDELAYADDFGLGAGIYPLDDAPEKPHICCLCNLVPIIADDIKKGDAVNKPPENWEEIKERLRHKNSFINMDELTEEQKGTLREQRREAYRRQKEKKEAEKAQKTDITPLTKKELEYQDPYKTILNTGNYSSWEKSITSNELVDIKDYTGTKFCEDINEFLRGSKNFDNDPEYKKRIENKIKSLDGALSRFTTEEQYTVYRGNYKRHGIENIKIGESFILDKGFLSSSFAESVADDFMGGDGSTLYRVRIPKGKNVGAYVDKVSAFQGEEEFLFRPNTRFKLLKIDKKERSYGLQWIYDLEVD